MRIKEKIRSALFYTALGIFSLLVSPVGWVLFLAWKLGGSARFRHLARWANWLYGRVAIEIIGWFVNIKRINTDVAKGLGKCVIVSNHQSILDLFILGAQGNPQVCPVTKLWPFRLLLPFSPAMLAAGYINVEGLAPARISRECRERIRENATLVFYPEGKRSRNGKLGRFHSGAFIFALEENLPIVPLVIRGSGKIIAPGSIQVNNGSIEVEMLSPILPESYEKFRSEPLPHRALSKYVRNMFILKLEEDTDEN